MRSHPLQPWFAWLERGAQKMMWRAMTREVREGRVRAPVAPSDPVGRLELAPGLEPPSYYTDWDIHLQPGGLWGSEEAALVYELGAKVVMLGDNDDYAFHRLFAETACPPARRVVDLGCGFGKSTRPFASARDATVVGVDLAGPTLALAHAQAEQRGLPIHFLQADACDTGLPDASADLVTATMLVHELPAAQQIALVQEAARLLAPGGSLRVLDFQPTGDPVRDLAMREHGQRNNEPFMPELFDNDLVTAAEDAGLVSVGWLPFDERGHGPAADAHAGRDEWHFPWAVLSGQRP